MQSILIKKEDTMKKIFFATICVVTSFLCSMEKPSTSLTIQHPDFVNPKPKPNNDPILRVKRQSFGSDQFVKEENAVKFFASQQKNQDEKK